MDTLELHRQWTEYLRAENGDEWVEEHAGLLAAEWDFLVGAHFLD